MNRLALVACVFVFGCSGPAAQHRQTVCAAATAACAVVLEACRGR